MYASINVATDAKHLNLEGFFTKYALNQHETTTKLTTLALNISKYNNVFAEANKEKKSKKTICVGGRWLEKCTQASAFREQVDERAS